MFVVPSTGLDFKLLFCIQILFLFWSLVDLRNVCINTSNYKFKISYPFCCGMVRTNYEPWDFQLSVTHCLDFKYTRSQ